MNRAIAGMAILVALSLPSCAFKRAADADAAKTQMIGMSKDQVLACMGAPAGKEAGTQTEVWSYPSGGETSTSSNASGVANSYGALNGNTYTGTTYATAYGTSTSKRKYCVVNVVMEDDHVTAINYSGRTGGLFVSGEQCAYAVENCIQ